MSLEQKLELLKDFPVPGPSEWEAEVRKALRGVAFESLTTHTHEGIDLKPIYTRRDLDGLSHTGGGRKKGPWEICQEIHYASPRDFNRALVHDLQRGQTAIALTPDTATRLGLDPDRAETGDVGTGGVSLPTLEDLAAALGGIQLADNPIHLDGGTVGLEMLMMLKGLSDRRGLNIKMLNGSVTTDPLARAAVSGGLDVPLTSIYDRMARATRWAARHAPGLRTIGVSGLPYHNGGADAVREAAFTLAVAVGYIDEMRHRGLHIDLIAPRMRFTLGIGSFYFMEIAKIRALRLLWSKIVAAYGGNENAQKMTLHARTSAYTQTRHDRYVNMLRTTTQAFSAVVGGVDSLHCAAFDEFAGEKPAEPGGDEFSRRIARNIHILLREESQLDQVIDPAGGSYYVEKLTHQVATHTWTLFQKIAAMGGMTAALQNGFPQEETARVHQQRCRDIEDKKSLVVGTNFSVDATDTDPPPVSPGPPPGFYDQRLRDMDEHRASHPQDSGEINGHIDVLEKAGTDSDDGFLTAGSTAFRAGATLGRVVAATAPAPRTGAGITITAIPPRRAVESFEQNMQATAKTPEV